MPSWSPGGGGRDRAQNPPPGLRRWHLPGLHLKGPFLSGAEVGRPQPPSSSLTTCTSRGVGVIFTTIMRLCSLVRRLEGQRRHKGCEGQ